MRLSDSGRLCVLFLVAVLPLALGGCGGSSADTHASDHGASHGHGDHGHDHGDHAGHEEHADHGHAHDAAKVEAEGATGGVDPVGAVKAFAQPPKHGAKAICPVCGEAFMVSEDTARSEHEGKHYVHCCAGCQAKFDADPAGFVAQAAEG